jgi:hypothetical protein
LIAKNKEKAEKLRKKSYVLFFIFRCAQFKDFVPRSSCRRRRREIVSEERRHFRSQDRVSEAIDADPLTSRENRRSDENHHRLERILISASQESSSFSTSTCTEQSPILRLSWEAFKKAREALAQVNISADEDEKQDSNSRSAVSCVNKSKIVKISVACTGKRKRHSELCDRIQAALIRETGNNVQLSGGAASSSASASASASALLPTSTIHGRLAGRDDLQSVISAGGEEGLASSGGSGVPKRLIPRSKMRTTTNHSSVIEHYNPQHPYFTVFDK